MRTYPQLSAVVVESSDDGGATWEIDNICWNVGEAAKKAREIPWRWRLRYVTLVSGELVDHSEAMEALEFMEKLEKIVTKS